MAKDQFWWFTGASVVALAQRLVDADPASARLEVRISADNKMTFRVVPSGAVLSANMALADQPDINDSFLCPPFCP